MRAMSRSRSSQGRISARRSSVQAGQRLIQQQDVGRRQKRPAQRDAAFLAARKMPGRALPEVFQGPAAPTMRAISSGAGALAHAPPAEQEIGFHTHMGEQPRILEHQAGAALFRRHERSRVRIQHGAAFQHDPALVRPGQPRQRMHDAGLARAGRPEQSGDAARRGGESHIQSESALAVADGDFRAHPSFFPVARRMIAWAASRNRKASTMESAEAAPLRLRRPATAAPYRSPAARSGSRPGILETKVMMAPNSPSEPQRR